MQNFIHQKIPEKYRGLLTGTLGKAERDVLLKLLAEEVAKEPPPKPRENR